MTPSSSCGATVVTERVYVDACVYVNVFIGGEQATPDRLRHGEWLLSQGQRGAVEIVTSPLVFAEVIGDGQVRGSNVSPEDRGSRIRRVRHYFRDNDLHWVDIDQALVASVSLLAVEHQLRGADAVHVACAIRADASCIFSWDRDMLKLDKRDLGLRFAEPQIVGQMQFES